MHYLLSAAASDGDQPQIPVNDVDVGPNQLPPRAGFPDPTQHQDAELVLEKTGEDMECMENFRTALLSQVASVVVDQ